MRSKFKTPSSTSPTGSRRGCLCDDNTYSTKCCDGSLQAQGIGSTTRIKINDFLLQENRDFLLKEDNSKIIL